MRMSKQVMIGLASGMAMCWSAAAAPPPALDRVPDDAAVAFVMPTMQGFVTDLRSFVNRVVPEAERADALAGLDMFNGMLNMPGMNAEGSAAAVMYMDQDDGMGTPPIVLVVPVSDFAQLRESMTAEGDGPVFEGQVNGESVYMKDIGGGFAAAGPMPELVQEFSGDAGHLAGHVERLGSQGAESLGANDVVMIANLEILSPYIKMAGEQMQQQMGMITMMMGPQAGQVQPMLEMVNGLMTRLADEGRTAVVGAQIDDKGVSFDSGVQFKDGTETFALLADKGNATKLLNRLPGSDFMFAYALDASHSGVGKAFEHMAQLSEQMGGGMKGVSFLEMIKNAKGMAGTMGSVPMMGAGLFSNFVTVTVTDEAKQTLETMGSAVKEANGQSAQGLKYTTAWQDGAAEIAGVKVSSYSMQMMPDGSPESQQIAPMMMIMPTLFGPNGGPNGFMAAVDGAVVQTMSQNTPLMEKAIKAAKDGNGLGSGEAIKAVGAHLPDNRVFEVYFSVDQVMNTVGPMAAMFGALPNFEKVDKLTPIGFGTSAGEGGMLNRFYVPNDVLSWFVEFSQQMEGGGFEDAPAEEEDGPRF